MAKQKSDGQIELKAVETGQTQFFDQDHAERILAYDVKISRKNWALVDSKLKFEDGKITTGSGNSPD